MDPDSSATPSQQPLALDLSETSLLPPKPPATVQELAALLQAGKVEEFNALRADEEEDDIVFKNLNFSRAIMDGADLNGCIFESCHFNQCSLVNATLTATLFKGCVMSGTYFDGASCANAHFERCTLSGVHFKSCDLMGAEFRMSDLSRCNFEGSWLEGEIYRPVKLIYAILIRLVGRICVCSRVVCGAPISGTATWLGARLCRRVANG